MRFAHFRIHCRSTQTPKRNCRSNLSNEAATSILACRTLELELTCPYERENDRPFSRLSCVSGTFRKLACSTRNVLLRAIHLSARSLHRQFPFPTTDRIPLIPIAAFAVCNCVGFPARCTRHALGVLSCRCSIICSAFALKVRKIQHLSESQIDWR